MIDAPTQALIAPVPSVSIPITAVPDLERDLLIAQAVWPWGDLNAKNVPEHWLRMSRDVQGTVALMAGQSPLGPRLLSISDEASLAQHVPTNLLTFIFDPVNDGNPHLVGPITVSPTCRGLEIYEANGVPLDTFTTQLYVQDQSNRIYFNSSVEGFPKRNTLRIPIDTGYSLKYYISVTCVAVLHMKVDQYFGDQPAGQQWVELGDRASRQLGHVTVDSTGGTVDVSDRIARLLGQVTPSLLSSDVTLIKRAPYATSLLNGNGINLVPGVAGKIVYCLEWAFTVVGASASQIALRDDGPSNIAIENMANAHSNVHLLYGVPSGVGLGVELHNYGAANSGEMDGELIYIQK
jgi:hypothetical protein